MSIGQLIIDQMLASLDSIRKSREHSELFLVETADETLRARVELEDADRLGCLVRKIEVARTAQPGKGGIPLSELRVKAEQLTQRLRYLLEDLAVVEVDCAKGVCQIRSAPAEVDEFYYELMLGAEGQASFVRYEKGSDVTGRKIRSMHLTLEVLERLMDDIATAV